MQEIVLFIAAVYYLLKKEIASITNIKAVARGSAHLRDI